MLFVNGRRLPIVYFSLPIRTTTEAHDRLEKLLYVRSPIPDPFGFPARSECATCAFTLESTNLIGTYTFCKPYSPESWNIFVQAMLEERPPADTVWNGTAESTKWYGRIS